MAKDKSRESSVNEDIVHKVHLALSNIETGEEVLSYLKSTEPVFMTEVSRFIQSEMHRLRYHLSEQQVLYVGSVIGAAYMAGFLIAREAAQKIYNGLIDFDHTLDKALGQKEIDKLMDKYHDEGKSPKEIGKCLRKLLKKNKKATFKRTKTRPKKKKQKLNMEGLE